MSTETYLVDTSIWIQIFRRSTHPHTKRVQRFFRRLKKEAKLVTTGMILAEFFQGLGESKKDQKIKEFLTRYEYLPSTKEIYILAGELSYKLAHEGVRIPLSDCLIAATALAYEAVLVSDDSHFKRIPDLKLKFIK